jgi:hypothetical protein
MNRIDAAVVAVMMLGFAHYKVGCDEDRRGFG